MKRYYGYETIFMEVAEQLQAFLNETVDKFEVSDGRTWHGEPMVYHFEIEATEEQVGIINDFLDNLYMNSVGEV